MFTRTLTFAPAQCRSLQPWSPKWKSTPLWQTSKCGSQAQWLEKWLASCLIDPALMSLMIGQLMLKNRIMEDPRHQLVRYSRICSSHVRRCCMLSMSLCSILIPIAQLRFMYSSYCWQCGQHKTRSMRIHAVGWWTLRVWDGWWRKIVAPASSRFKRSTYTMNSDEIPARHFFRCPSPTLAPYRPLRALCRSCNFSPLSPFW